MPLRDATRRADGVETLDEAPARARSLSLDPPMSWGLALARMRGKCLLGWDDDGVEVVVVVSSRRHFRWVEYRARSIGLR
jgi:hypothetical protein